MIAGADKKLPYGNLPRLLLAWISTEAVAHSIPRVGFSLTRPQRLSWKQLYRQFGVDPSRASDNVTVQRFRKSCLRELKKIKLAWPELNYTTAKGVLILFPSKPAIAPTTGPQRLVE